MRKNYPPSTYCSEADSLSGEVKQFIMDNNSAFGWSEQSTLRDFDSPFSNYCLLYIADELVGYMGWQEIFEEANINFVFIHPASRGEGLARILFEAGLKEMAKANIEKINLEVRAHNLPALALYRRFNFKELDRRLAYYINPRDDALIMQKKD